MFTSSDDLVQYSVHLGFNFIFYIKCRILVFNILIRLLNFSSKLDVQIV